MSLLQRFFSVAAIVLLLAGCGGKDLSEEKAMASAQHSYEQLVSGNYAGFLEGRAGMDSIPDGYRKELLTAYKQFMAQQQKAHGGILSVKAGRAETDTLQQIVQVFIIINYADSLQEEIVVPMIEHQGEWKMK